MRFTLILKDKLVQKAQELTGISEKTALIHEGLKLLIQREAAKKLSKLGGYDPSAKAALRRKTSSKA